MTSITRPLPLTDADATRRLAARISPLLRAGDVILLAGPIGAGKTHFARSLIQTRLAAADLMEDVPSPTFTLIQTYEAAGVALWHADLYRLTDPDEATELGLEEAFTQAICLIEWPDRLGSLRPPQALELTLTPDAASDLRQARFIGDAAHWAALFACMEGGQDG
ncbi:MAG: tRNA (adenosine(37)-N6)-threonylcarbamoyltransferase complex ATPase subunit type 1 TsaE [Rhodobacteraceae bacterium]|nr:tRNA (adenosine(37)-N6)-threonylcarbamoyltransferase complex ATPase subunit type 1 TsaE [Paracoccaceae bacterium]